MSYTRSAQIRLHGGGVSPDNVVAVMVLLAELVRLLIIVLGCGRRASGRGCREEQEGVGDELHFEIGPSVVRVFPCCLLLRDAVGSEGLEI